MDHKAILDSLLTMSNLS